MSRWKWAAKLSAAVLTLVGGCADPGAERTRGSTQSSTPRGQTVAGTTAESAAPAEKNAKKSEANTEGTMTTTGDKTTTKTETAIFAAGCFWGVESKFMETPGVVATTVGYTGGKTEKPTYKEVCTDLTGHAEAVRVEFDPTKISYEKLVELFFANHDPTQVNRQGPDVGTQYRSAIFYTTPEQKQIAEQMKVKLGNAGKYKRPIATEIVAAQPFWAAEEYHQQYLKKRGLSSCGTGH